MFNEVRHGLKKLLYRQSRKFRFKNSNGCDYLIILLCHSLNEHRLASRPPSRLPFDAQPRRGPDGTRPRCERTRSGMREWQVLLWLVVLKAELSTLPDRNFLLCPDTHPQEDL